MNATIEDYNGHCYTVVPCYVSDSSRIHYCGAYAKDFKTWRVFAVKHGMALASAMEMVGESYGIDTAPLKRLIPAEENPGYLNATMLAGKLGLLSKTGNPKASDANAKLAELGLQKKEGKEWRLTDKGREYGEEKPFTRNGHSGYNIGWNEKVLVLFEQPVKV